MEENRVLKLEIEALKLRIKQLGEENKALRLASVSIQARAEQEEEFISNTLLKRIQVLTLFCFFVIFASFLIADGFCLLIFGVCKKHDCELIQYSYVS